MQGMIQNNIKIILRIILKSNSRHKYLLISISETTKLLLTSCIPAIESNFSTVSEEIQRMNFHTNSCCIHQKYTNKSITSTPQNQLIKKIRDLRSYFFSNSPVRCLFTNVVFPALCKHPEAKNQ